VTRVLLVEDDRALRHSIEEILAQHGYSVRVVADGAAGVRELQTGGFELVLLDIGLPFIDGWRILGTLEGKRLPSVIVISARGEEQDKVRALDLGADDYLAKPFGADELLARVRAVLRRAQPIPGPSRVINAGAVRIDLAGQSVLREGAEVRLSPTEYGLLSVLVQHAGQVMDHRTLLRTVWGPAYGDERNYLRTFIQRLRSKLEADPRKPEIIVTVGARGYRFGPPIAAENR
jgi:two-component system, OmpR family, KDP operon response regulator KdpE